MGKDIPPEQCRANGGPIDDRSDVYSLGVVLFELLAGRPPFQAKAPGELIAMHIIEQAPRIDVFVQGVPLVLRELLECMLRKKPAERPAMREVQNILSALADGLPTEAMSLAKQKAPERPDQATPGGPGERRRIRPGVAVLAGTLLLTCIGVFSWRLAATESPRKPLAEPTPSPRPAVPPLPGAAANDRSAAASPGSAPLVLPPPPAQDSAPAELREPSQPAPAVHRDRANRRRSKTDKPRPAEPGASHDLTIPPVF